MTIITQDKSKIFNLPENIEWKIWFVENPRKSGYEVFLTIGRTGGIEKIAEFKDKYTAQDYIKQFVTKM